jgi:trimethylamine-N-oxide reductase (cytochrome c)
VLPNTDAALQLGIIYTWINEDTYDKTYLETHAVGFDKIKEYVMGEVDGVPKTQHGLLPNVVSRHGQLKHWQESGHKK